jgi:L-alanine-DL-glutamate epimerase-like enolase superfamily enzyme
MKITALETLQLPHLDNILWVRVHTDEGMVGLGEAFRGACAVARNVHTDVSRQILGSDPLAVDAISKALTEPTSASARPGSRCGPPRRSTSRSGTSSAR